MSVTEQQLLSFNEFVREKLLNDETDANLDEYLTCGGPKTQVTLNIVKTSQRSESRWTTYETAIVEHRWKNTCAR